MILATATHLLATGDDDLGAGMIAFLVVLAMSVSCYFLFRSMVKHMHKVPTTFDQPPVEVEDP